MISYSVGNIVVSIDTKYNVVDIRHSMLKGAFAGLQCYYNICYCAVVLDDQLAKAKCLTWSQCSTPCNRLRERHSVWAASLVSRRVCKPQKV